MPGIYTVQLTTRNGELRDVYRQTFEIKMDPRVKMSAADLQKQHDLSLQCYTARKKCLEHLKEVRRFRSFLQSQLVSAERTAAERVGGWEKRAAKLENTAQGSTEPSFSRLNNNFASLFGILQDADRPPTSQVISAVAESLKQLEKLEKEWNELKKVI
jgi:hypothetical protein